METSNLPAAIHRSVAPCLEGSYEGWKHRLPGTGRHLLFKSLEGSYEGWKPNLLTTAPLSV